MGFLRRFERSKMVRNSVLFNSCRISRAVYRDSTRQPVFAFCDFINPILRLGGAAKVVPSVVCWVAVNVVNLVRRPFTGHVKNRKSMRQILAAVQSYPKHIMDRIVAASYITNLTIAPASLAGPAPKKASLRFVGQKFLQPSVGQHQRLSSIPGV
jgi:hypothetical protein